MTAKGRAPRAPEDRARAIGWALILAVLLGAVGGGAWLLSMPRSTAPAADASPKPSASGKRRHPRPEKGKETARPSAASPSTARGRVVEASGGGPIAGAKVTIHGDHDAVAELVTDERGAFEASVAAAKIELEIKAPGFVGVFEPMFLPHEPVTIRLVRGAVLSGQVVRGDNGEPVAGARVGAGGDADMGIGAVGGELDESWMVVTDASGRFRIEGLAAGEYRPVAAARGFYAQASSRVRLATGEVGPEVVIRMEAAATIRGRLEISSTHEACAAGSVRLMSNLYGWIDGSTDRSGRVVFDAVLPGTYEVRMSCEDHATEQQAPPLVVASADMDVVFSLQEKLAVTGVVVTPGGEPVPDALVEASRVGEEEMGSESAHAVSEEDGQFAFHDLAAGTYEITASHAPDAPKVQVTVVEGAPPPVVRVVYDVLPLRGRVVDPEGEPIPEAQVTGARDPSGNGSFGTGVDREGRFLVRQFGPGKVTLAVEVGGVGVELQGGAAVVTLPLSGEVTLVAITPRGKIEGAVSGRAGPRGGVRVEARCSEKQATSAETDEAGRFTLRGVPEGAECALHAIAPDGESAVARGVRAGGRVDLTLRPAAKLLGTVAGAGAAFSVNVDCEGFGREEVFFASRGVWEMGSLPAGDCTVHAETERERGSAKVTLAPGEERSIALTLAPSPDLAPE